MLLSASFSAFRMFFTFKIFCFSIFPENYQLAGQIVYYSLYDIRYEFASKWRKCHQVDSDEHEDNINDSCGEPGRVEHREFFHNPDGFHFPVFENYELVCKECEGHGCEPSQDCRGDIAERCGVIEQVVGSHVDECCEKAENAVCEKV